MQLRLLSLFFVITVLFCSCNSNNSGNIKSDTIKKNFDIPPDPELRAFLNSLPRARRQDTALSNIAITIHERKYPLSAYIQAQAYKAHPEHFLVRPSAEIIFLANLSEKDKLLPDLFVKLRDTAIKICADHVFKDERPGNPKYPFQDHIGYSWGSKDYLKRRKPDDQCTYYIHGLDCSGFFYQIFLPLKIDFSVYGNDAEDERQPGNIEKTLQHYFGSVRIHAHDKFLANDFQTGDIIYFMSPSKHKASHIGIVLETLDGHTSFFATFHGDSCKTAVCCKPKECCFTNLSSGPQILFLDKITADRRFHGIVRLSVSN